MRSVKEKMLLTSFGVETSCAVPGRFRVVSPRSTGLSALRIVRLILIFWTRHRGIFVVAALLTLASHSLMCWLSACMDTE